MEKRTSAKSLTKTADPRRGDPSWDGPSWIAPPVAEGFRSSPGTARALRQPHWKRTVDIAGAVVGLVALSPVLLVAGAAICIVSPGAPIFGQQRVGYRGKRFTLWKLRTMHADVDSAKHQRYVENLAKTNGRLNKLDVDRHVVRFGSLFRKLAIDELPQLFNVLRGDMSLVGPRPDVIDYEEYQSEHRRRFEVVPGMTGLWQVAGKNRTTFSEMIEFDLMYVERRSFWLDVKILLMTVPAIVRQLGSDR